jgi:hypothetical protein
VEEESIMMNQEEYQRTYQEMRARGKNYKTCIIAMARKFLRFLFAFYWKKTIVFAHEEQSTPLVLPVLSGTPALSTS